MKAECSGEGSEDESDSGRASKNSMNRIKGRVLNLKGPVRLIKKKLEKETNL